MLFLLLVIVLLLPCQLAVPAEKPEDAVFQVVTYDRGPGSDGIFRSHGFGTGFFVSPDGIADTASHVTYLAATQRQKYRLLAVVDNEFYDAAVLCASKLPYDPTKPDTLRQGVPFTRDVAQIKLTPSTAFEGRKDTLYYRMKDGTQLEWAKAHTGPLPQFPYLTVGGNVGQHVRIIGYGAISALPYRWTVEGQVSRLWRGRDGTEVFDITSRNPAVPGDSGAPVLNDAGEVVGLWAWHYYMRPDTGTAQRSSVLTKACR
jgi:hypothetical protein